MYLSQITRLGRVVQTNGAPAFTNKTNPKEIALAGNCRDYLLVYQRTDESAVPRLRARILDAAPQLIKPTNGSGQFSFTVDAAAERTYEIQSSENFQLWSAAGLVTNQTGLIQFSTNTLPGKQFFRAQQLE